MENFRQLSSWHSDRFLILIRYWPKLDQVLPGLLDLLSPCAVQGDCKIVRLGPISWDYPSVRTPIRISPKNCDLHHWVSSMHAWRSHHIWDRNNSWPWIHYFIQIGLQGVQKIFALLMLNSANSKEEQKRRNIFKD